MNKNSKQYRNGRDMKQHIESIENPLTGETLGKEERILKAEERDGEFWLEWSSNGIPLEVKRELEKNILQALKSEYASDKVNIISRSQRSEGAGKASGQGPSPREKQAEGTRKANQAAALRVGHEQSGGGKKRVSGVKHVIAVGSGKGGVGKSSFSVNLALALKERGLKTGLVDADIYGPSLPMMLGKRFSRPYATEDKKIEPLKAYGLQFMSFGVFIEENDPVVWRGPMLGGVLNQFLFDVKWEDLDVLIVDLPPGTGDIQISLVQNLELDGLIVVTTPQNIASLDARRALAMGQKLEVKTLGVVENMAGFQCDQCEKMHYPFGQGAGEKLSERMSVDFLGDIPMDIDIQRGSDQGVPFFHQQAFKERPAYSALRKVAARVEEKIKAGQNEKSSWFSKVLGRKK